LKVGIGIKLTISTDDLISLVIGTIFLSSVALIRRIAPRLTERERAIARLLSIPFALFLLVLFLEWPVLMIFVVLKKWLVK
jgi:hypothetical protein